MRYPADPFAKGAAEAALKFRLHIQELIAIARWNPNVSNEQQEAASAALWNSIPLNQWYTDISVAGIMRPRAIIPRKMIAPWKKFQFGYPIVEYEERNKRGTLEMPLDEFLAYISYGWRGFRFILSNIVDEDRIRHISRLQSAQGTSWS